MSDDVEAACRVWFTAWESACMRPGSEASWDDVPESERAAVRVAVTALLDHLSEARRPRDIAALSTVIGLQAEVVRLVADGDALVKAADRMAAIPAKVERLCDAQGESSYVMVHALRKALAGEDGS